MTALAVLLPVALVTAAALNPRTGTDGKPLPRSQRSFRGDLWALVS